MTRARIPWLVLALAALPLAALGCGDHKKKPTENPAEEEVTLMCLSSCWNR